MFPEEPLPFSLFLPFPQKPEPWTAGTAVWSSKRKGSMPQVAELIGVSKSRHQIAPPRSHHQREPPYLPYDWNKSHSSTLYVKLGLCALQSVTRKNPIKLRAVGRLRGLGEGLIPQSTWNTSGMLQTRTLTLQQMKSEL